MKAYFGIFSVMAVLSFFSCATDPGDEVHCPECNNTSELLVGNKCVPIAEVAVCGPDGHAHGEECHCFSEQNPEEIAGKMYCLQQGCGVEETECNGHGHLEDGACHCDEGFVQDPHDKTKCVTEEHEHEDE